MPSIQARKLAAKSKRVMDPSAYIQKKNEEQANSPFQKKLITVGKQRVMSPKSYMA